MEFWLALQYGTAKSVGLKDQKFLELESSHFNFPADVPDCDAGLNEFKEEYINLQVIAMKYLNDSFFSLKSIAEAIICLNDHSSNDGII